MGVSRGGQQRPSDGRTAHGATRGLIIAPRATRRALRDTRLIFAGQRCDTRSAVFRIDTFMADSRNIVAAISVVIALIATGWAIFVTHRDEPAVPAATNALAGASGAAFAKGRSPGPAAPVGVITAPVASERVS